MATIIRWYVYADNESRFKKHYTLSSLNHWGWIWFFWLIIPASVGSFGLWFYSLSQRGATTSSFLF